MQALYCIPHTELTLQPGACLLQWGLGLLL